MLKVAGLSVAGALLPMVKGGEPSLERGSSLVRQNADFGQIDWSN